MLDNIAALVGVAGGLVAIYFAWRQARESALRREDVLQWANEVIAAMESLLLLCMLREPQIDEAAARDRVTRIIFDTAILVERGRMFFRNQPAGSFGNAKEPAYRGLRPRILDPIVVAHQVACNWPEADTETRLRLRAVAEDWLKKFVSLAQKEVGRSRTASADTARGGQGVHLPRLVAEVDAERLARLRPTPGLAADQP